MSTENIEVKDRSKVTITKTKIRIEPNSKGEKPYIPPSVAKLIEKLTGESHENASEPEEITIYGPDYEDRHK